ncbi:MAG TPA: hypothetical protein VKP14_10135 [Gaiellaceae bacterium]|nr:hypothetical protein [Gaiellaceae bacterium]
MAIEPGSLYQSPLLSNVAVNYKNRTFIAERVLTPLSVPKLECQYLEWDRAAHFKLAQTRTTPNAAPGQLELKATKKSFTLGTHALSDYTDEQERALAGPGIALEAYKTEALTAAMRLRLEHDVASALRDPTQMPLNTTVVGNDQWDDYVHSDPASQILEQADRMLIKPNVFIGGRRVITALRRHPKILDVTKYTERGKVSMEALADYLEVDEILTGEAFVDTAALGQPESKDYVWGLDAILGYRTKETPSPLMDQPTLGYLPRWGTGSIGPDGSAMAGAAAGAPPWRVYTARNPFVGTGEGSTFVKVETSHGVLLSGAAVMGYLFKNAVSA